MRMQLIRENFFLLIRVCKKAARQVLHEISTFARRPDANNKCIRFFQTLFTKQSIRCIQWFECLETLPIIVRDIWKLCVGKLFWSSFSDACGPLNGALLPRNRSNLFNSKKFANSKIQIYSIRTLLNSRFREELRREVARLRSPIW